jgi:hypothetical protein
MTEPHEPPSTAGESAPPPVPAPPAPRPPNWLLVLLAGSVVASVVGWAVIACAVIAVIRELDSLAAAVLDAATTVRDCPEPGGFGA